MVRNTYLHRKIWRRAEKRAFPTITDGLSRQHGEESARPIGLLLLLLFLLLLSNLPWEGKAIRYGPLCAIV
jgi:hypothetical protein